MIPVEKALKVVLKGISAEVTEPVPITDATGRVVSKDITANFNIPLFNNSAMDGYALKYSDTISASQKKPVILKITGEAKAGTPFVKKVNKKSAVKIMTGAIIPDGADCVVKIEDASEKDGYVYVKSPVRKSAFVRKAGEDVKKGETVLKSGKSLKPADIGMLATLNMSRVSVYKRPHVAILCTGDELVDAGGDGGIGSVVCSNYYSLLGLVTEAGGIPVNLGIVKDDKRALLKKLKKGLKYDILITTGGISVGDYDYVREVLEELGAKSMIFKVAMKPGKPFSYFVHGDTKVFALAGNPVSCMVSFEVFVRPAILKFIGNRNIFRRQVDAILKQDIAKTKGVMFFVRGIIKKDKNVYSVRSTGPQGSAILKSMSLANCLIIADKSREIIKKGEVVKVIIIDNSFENVKSI